MRVLMITPGYYPIKGGTETMVQALSNELIRSGIQTDIMAFNMDQKWRPKWRGKTEKIDGTTVIKIPALDWFPIAHSPRINLGVNLVPGRFTYLLKNYDVLHFHEAEFSFPLFSLLVKKPKLLHIHALDFSFFERYHLSRLMLRCSANLFLAITKQMKAELVRLGVPQDKVRYFPNSVDTQLFRPGARKSDDTLLYVGRLTPNKSLHVLLRSLDSIETPVRLWIIGPPGWNVDYNRLLMRSIDIQNRKGKHQVTYLGLVDKKRLVECYQEASIFVLPSSHEPFGVVLLEALSCGTPVVSTFAGGIPEVISNGQNGILVPANNHQELAKAIQNLLDNKNVRARFGRAGRDWVLGNFSIKASAKKLSNIYADIVAKSHN